jgi:hypothetical protein
MNQSHHSDGLTWLTTAADWHRLKSRREKQTRNVMLIDVKTSGDVALVMNLGTDSRGLT